MAHNGNQWARAKIQTHPGQNFQYQSDSEIHLDGTGDILGVMFAVPEDMSLTGGCFSSGALVGSSPTYVMELWPASTTTQYTPDMSGSALATTAGFTGVGSNERVAKTFTAAYAATQGQVLCLLVKHSSGTIDSSNRITAKVHAGRCAGSDVFPVAVSSFDGGSSWSKFGNKYPGFTVTTNKTYDIGGVHTTGSSFTQSLYWGDAAGDRIANKFVLPTEDKPMLLYISGFTFYGLGPQANDEAKVACWKEDGTVLAYANIDPEQSMYYLNSVDHFCEYTFTSDVEMESGGTYYVGFEQLDAADPFQVQFCIIDRGGGSGTGNNDDGYRSWPLGTGIRMKKWESTGSSWTDYHYTHCRILMDLNISDMHGKYEESEECPPCPTGKGDTAGERAPSRVKDTGKPGYKLNALKSIQRDAGAYGWNPYA